MARDTFVVRGVVYGTNGQGMPNVLVRAFDKDLRSEEVLGEATTDADGRYEIAYRLQQFRRAEKRSADLVVRAFVPGAADAAEPLASSQVVFNAAGVEIVDLLARPSRARRTSEYERYLDAIRPVVEQVPLHALTRDDIRFIAAETRIGPRVVGFLAAASAAAEKTGVAAEAFYALFRQGLPTRLPMLFLQPARRLRRALLQSVHENVIAEPFAQQVDEIVGALQALLAHDDLGAASTILGAAAVPRRTRVEFLASYRQRSGTPADFWRDIAASNLPAAHVEELRFTLQLGLLTQGNAALVQELRSAGVDSTSRLVDLDEAAWRAHIERAGVGSVPADVPGATPEERIAAYSREIVATVQEGFAMERLRIEAVRDGSLDARVRSGLAAFFAASRDFDLDDMPVDAYIREHPERLADVEDRDGVTSQLKRLQRVYRIAPRYEHVQALLDAGIHSAFAIASMPLATFVEQLGDRLGGEAQAQMYYANAQKATAGAALLYTDMYKALRDPAVAAAGSGNRLKDSLADVPSIEHLFGSMDFCACQHCRSTFGAAAYFVELLQYLRKGSTTAFNVLMNRRPDLQHIKLSCVNTNTPLPYVDLVNEVLESYVRFGDFSQVAPQEAPQLAHDTGLSASELSVNPEHTRDEAYVKLAQAVHTFVLPFNRPLEVARAYLEHLGSSRYEMLATFQNDANPSAATPTNLALALECLTISAEERVILAGTSPAPARAFYGYTGPTGIHIDPDGNTTTEPWKANLARVPQFLRRTGLDYPDVVELLKTRFVNPGQDPSNLPADAIVLLSAEGSCDLNRTWIQHPTSNHQNLDATGLEDAAWVRLHRFLRLWKKLAWSMREVDHALHVLGSGTIDDGVLEKLATVHRLRSRLKLPLDRLLAFWGPIDTFGDDALYRRLFLNKAVLHDPTDTSFALNAQGTALLDGSVTLSDHVPALLAALQLGAADLDVVRGAIGLADQIQPPIPAAMTLAGLSGLYRHVALARALKLTIRELASLKVLTGVDPFVSGDPAATEAFVRQVDQVKTSRFSVAQLDYLFRHQWPASRPAAPSQDSVEDVLKTLQDNLRKIVDDTAVVADPTGDTLRVKLTLALDGTLVDGAMEVIEGQPASLVLDKPAFIDQHLAQFFPDLAEAKLVLLNSPSFSAATRRDYVLPHLLSYLRDTMSRDVVTQSLGDALGIDATLLQDLLERVLQSTQVPSRPAMDDFLALAGDGLIAEYFDDTNLQGTVVTRIDPAVNFYWGNSAPAEDLTPASFSARWSGFLVPRHGEAYSFYVRANDGARLWIGDLTQPLIDAWSDQDQAVEHQAFKALEAGQVYPVRLEYYKDGPDASVELSWSSLSTPKAHVPQSHTYSNVPFVLQELVKLYGRLHKIALLANRFRITASELAYLSSHGADFGGFDLSGLPLEASDSQAAALFAQWNALREVLTLRDRLPAGGDVGLFDVFGAAANPLLSQTEAALKARDVLAVLTGWKGEDLEFLATIALGIPDSAFRNATGPVRLHKAFDLAGKLGLSVQQLRTWTVTGPDAAQARKIVHAVKARYDDEAWPTAAKPLSDALRNKQKQALVAYVLAHPDIVQERITDADGLFEYFLIDVQMNPCMVTSRLKQAISSVQLFVQRCLLNLEKEAPAKLLDADRWKWMKNYRLWEANRKVFIWPENWIEAELRDDKSPFFRELETQLRQHDLTDEHVEIALMKYLERLEDVSRLEIAGVYRQKESGADVVHLIARSFNPPVVYYYRRFDVRTETWTAWEQIPVDIEGEHLVPVVWNRRLYVFWTTFAEKPDNNKNPSANGQTLPDGAGPFTFWEIKLAWTERRQSGWTPKKTASKAVASEGFWQGFDWGSNHMELWCLPEPRRHYLKTSVDGDGLTVTLFRKYSDHTEKALWEGVYYDPTGLGLPYEGHERVGKLHFTGCGGRAETDSYPALIDYDSVEGPEGTRNVFMGFSRGAYDGHLTLQDEDTTDILETMKDPFTFLHAPSVQEPAKPPYPFLVQDPWRTYFAMPTATTGAIREAFKHPLVVDVANVNEMAVSQVPDVGPGPVQMGTRFPAVESLRTAAAQSRTSGALAPARSAGPSLALSSGPLEGFVPLASAGGEPEMMFMKSPAAEPALQSSAHGVGAGIGAMVAAQGDFKFHMFFHPHVCAWMKALNKGGLASLLTLANQQLTHDPTNSTVFKGEYDPTSKVHWKHPRENVEFEWFGPFALYNWEVFFHAPMLIADRLSKDQRFEEAQRWFHYIFNPTHNSSGEAPARYWKVKPLHEYDQGGRIQDLLETLNHGTKSQKKALEQQVEEWRDNPFNPHLIARRRLSAYQLTVVMKYLDNLIAWGDHLFARDTLESINEATQLYVLAWHLLGRRPAFIPARTAAKDMTYKELLPHLDAFSNAWVELENLFPSASIDSLPVENGSVGPEALGTTMAFYFCIPPNERLLNYWNVVEDRLFKVRHCMNIEGITRQLPLFEPPIDPALLVKATAAGVDVGSLLSDVSAPLPHYRFGVLVQKSLELCADVKSLGGALLSALEKKDAEALAALRAAQEAALLKAAREVRKQQVDEARAQIEALRATRRVIEERQRFYAQINHRIGHESEQLEQLKKAHQLNQMAQVIEWAASAAAGVPNFSFGGAGLTGSPLTSVSFGGGNISAALQSHARSIAYFAAAHSHQANLASIVGAWARRSAEWRLQALVAQRELAQNDKQIAAAEIRLAITENELANHDVQIENAGEVEAFLRNKYTNQDLYGWMQSQISATYFQTYKLAYDLARRAEKAYRFERGLTSTSFIQFGYWDSLKKGLLAGERLYLDLKRLDAAYLDQNKREYEITKHVSLLALDPLALLVLRETGRCEFRVPEALFDLDYPGQYMRRLKSVSLTIPCVAGPYAGVHCTLTLLASKIRVDPNAQRPYEEEGSEDTRFVSYFGALQSIATSTAQNDSGLFEVNFRDDRYLPFEGAGAIGSWRLNMPRECNAFDFDTISDVILRLQYTAREGGELLRTRALEAATLPAPAAPEPVAALPAFPGQEGQSRLFSARHEFPTEWHRFLHVPDAETRHTLVLDVSSNRFPFVYRDRDVAISGVDLFLKLKDGLTYVDHASMNPPFTLRHVEQDGQPGEAFENLTFRLLGSPVGALAHVEAFGDESAPQPLGRWEIEVQEQALANAVPAFIAKSVIINGQSRRRLSADAVENLFVLVHYAVGEAGV